MFLVSFSSPKELFLFPTILVKCYKMLMINQQVISINRIPKSIYDVSLCGFEGL